MSYNDPAEWGDTDIWLALDSENKLLISHFAGKRDVESAHAFVRDFSERLHPMWRCQFTSDGFRPYIDAVEASFGADINFTQLIKVYGKPDNAVPDR